jgi:prepilin-type processing-associated H-X9-DG protein
LIEVLVVVAIIALLVAILIPSLSRARQQARNTMCRSNMKQVMSSMQFYIADYKVLPATLSTYYNEYYLHGNSAWWPSGGPPAGVTWDGARGAAYTEPYSQDPAYVEDVPRKGTIFKYNRQPEIYLCPSDKPGSPDDTPVGGGGNGQLSYSMNAYIGFKSPNNLRSFRYVEASSNNPIPSLGTVPETRSFAAGQRVGWSDADFMVLFEEHPYSNINNGYPEGNFNGPDEVAIRHMPKAGGGGTVVNGRANIGFLDGHVESRILPSHTEARELFAEFGMPILWPVSGSGKVNMTAFVKEHGGPTPW